jgi:hypothetical protein
VKSALFDTEFDSPIWAVVVVNQMDPLNGKVDYKIRMNFTTVPRTWRTIHKHRIGLLTYYKHYYTSGFLSLQDAINSYVLKLAPKSEETDDVLDKRLMWGAAFPVPAHSRNKFYKAVGPMLGLMMCLSTLYPLGMLVKVMQMGGGLRVNSFTSANLNLLGVGGVKISSFSHCVQVF